MNIQTFLEYKNYKENKILNLDNIKNFNLIIKKYKNKYNKKKNNNILKNFTLKNNKNKIENKTNLILNKLSSKNIDLIIEEFIKSINFKDIFEYHIFLKTLYIKILNEIQFIDIYIKFFKFITELYEYKFNYTQEYFIIILESKINYDYLNNNLNENMEWLENYNNENYRKNNLEIIRYMVNKNLLNNKILKLLNSIILNQTKYYCDIYNWFLNNNITNTEKSKINIIIKNNNLNFRNKTLLTNLINNKENNNIINNTFIQNNKNNINKINISKFKNNTDKKVTIERFNIESTNIYEEYLHLELIEEVINFIKDDCKTANIKNCFCKNGLKIFFSNNTSIKNNELILSLFNKLIESKSLYKSNLSRGLLLLIKENKKLDINKLKKYLYFLKNNCITKGIDFLLKKYNIL